MNFGTPTIITTKLGPVEYLEEGNGPAVLCIHGAMGGYDQSMTLARTIGEPRYRYIAVSRPGYLGTPIRSGRTAAEQADLHAALLDALGIKSTIVMAISGGGPSAMYFALRHRQKCEKLILCSTVGSPAKQKIPFAFHLMCLLAKITPLIKLMQKKTASDLRAAISRSISDPAMVTRVMNDPEVMELFKIILLGSFDRMAERTSGTKYDISISATFTCKLEDIVVPTLIVHGDKDPLVPFKDHGNVLAQRIPHAKLCLAQGGEHVTIFTHREQVRKAVKEFLDQNPGERGAQ